LGTTEVFLKASGKGPQHGLAGEAQGKSPLSVFIHTFLCATEGKGVEEVDILCKLYNLEVFQEVKGNSEIMYLIQPHHC
jgi:hypothetical protein